MKLRPLVLWLPGGLINPMNSTMFLWKHRRWARTRREQSAEVARVALLRDFVWRDVEPAAPKRVEFLAIVPKRFDDDGLRAALKPSRDGLADARLIHHDGPKSGHLFLYAQHGTRSSAPGVHVTIALAEDAYAEPNHPREGDDERDA